MAHRSLPPPPIEDRPDPIWADIEARAGTHRLLDQLRRRSLPVVGSIVALAAGWWLLRPAAAPPESQIPVVASSTPVSAGTGSGGAAAGGDAAASPAGTTTSEPPDVVVQASGAVQQPGVYHLAAGSRVDDLVRRAGGLRGDADRTRLNLAAPLMDGQRIWIPAEGEKSVPSVVGGDGGSAGSPGAGAAPGGSAPSTGTAPGPISLNTASETELDELPGVGPATAQAIVAYREQVGRFSSIDELLDVRGIGEAKLEQLRPLVTL